MTPSSIFSFRAGLAATLLIHTLIGLEAASAQPRIPDPLGRKIYLPATGIPKPILPGTLKPAIGIIGAEIAVGPAVTIAAVSIVELTAQCPVGKVAISAGMDLATTGEAVFGAELRGTWVNGDRIGHALLRNANVFSDITGRAIAVCIVPIPGMRSIMFGGIRLSARSPAHRVDQACAAGERLIGGGVMGNDMTQIAANAPQGATPETAIWREVVAHQNTVVIPGLPANAEARALCAPASGVDGWSFVESAPVSLAPRSMTTLSISCPAGKTLLAAGIVQQSSNYIDMLANDLAIPGDGTATGQVINRNIVRGGDDVRATLAGICARKQ